MRSWPRTAVHFQFPRCRRNTHTLILRGKARRPGTTGRTHHHDRRCFLLSRLIAPQQTISHWAATDNITGLGLALRRRLRFGLPELMLCLAPTTVWFGCYLRFSGRLELIPCFASAVLSRLRGRFSGVDAMLRFGAVFGSDYCCYFCCGTMLRFDGGRVYDSMAAAEYVSSEDINRRG